MGVVGGGVGYLLCFSYAGGTEIIWFSYSYRLCSWLDYYASVLSWQLSSHAKQAAEPREIFANLTCPQCSRGSAAKEYSTCRLILPATQAILTHHDSTYTVSTKYGILQNVSSEMRNSFSLHKQRSLDSKTRTRSKRIS